MSYDINDSSVYDDNYTVLSKIRKIMRQIKDLITRVTNLENSGGYTLPIASDSRLGGIKVGENLTIEDDGTLNAQAGGGGGYTLPTATDERLGGIKVGSRLSVQEDGTLSADEQSYTLPIASQSNIGGVKVGENLTIDSDGTLNATGGGGGGGGTPSDVTPQMDGTGSAGVSTTYSRGDHVHPSQIVELTQAQYDDLVLSGTVNPNVTYYISDAGSAGYIQQINATASVGSGTGVPTVQVEKSGSDSNPTFAFSFNNLKGENGQNGIDGTNGTNGTDGVSPAISVEQITGGHRVNITDATHPASNPETFDVMDGTDGTNGTNGKGVVDYSSAEQNTGVKWINNNDIYRKVVTGTMPSSINTEKTISISGIDISKIIRMDGFMGNSSFGLNLPFVDSSGGTVISSAIAYLTPNTIHLKTMDSDIVNMPFVVIFEYYK